jgi:hypothetical protein
MAVTNMAPIYLSIKMKRMIADAITTRKFASARLSAPDRGFDTYAGIEQHVVGCFFDAGDDAR